MKKLFALLLLLPLFYQCNNSNKVELKLEFKENHVYTQVINQKISMDMNYKGGKDPIETNTDMQLEAVITTGSADASGTIPVEMDYKKASVSAGLAAAAMPKLEGVKMFGKILKGKQPEYDSIVGDSLDFRTKKLLPQIMNGITSQIKTPKKKMAVGDEESISFPLETPIPIFNMKMMTITKYKLVSIKGDRAFFDVNLSYEMSADKGLEISGGGKGAGTMEYDITNQYFRAYNLKTDMTIKSKILGMSVDMSTHQESDIKVDIQPRKK